MLMTRPTITSVEDVCLLKVVAYFKELFQIKKAKSPLKDM
jgi:hypothetical protein